MPKAVIRVAIGLLAVATMGCAAFDAWAGTVSAGSGDTAAGGHSTQTPYTFDIGPYNQLNPATGGLRDITFSLQTSLFGQVHVMTSSSGTFAVELAALFQISEPNTSTVFLTDESAYESDSADNVPAGGAIIVESGSAMPSYSVSTSSLTPLQKAGLFSYFTGTGTYLLPVNASAVAAVNPAPNEGYTSSADARAIVGITYTYGPATATAVTSLQAIYSASAQNGTLYATVTSNNAPVAGGTVYFALTDGTSQIGATATAGPNGQGVAAAAFTLPAGQALGTYTLIATYDGGSSDGLSQGAAPFYIRANEIFQNGFQ